MKVIVRLTCIMVSMITVSLHTKHYCCHKADDKGVNVRLPIALVAV